MTRMDYPQSGLTALLDALERELLAAHADELRNAWRETGRARNIAYQEVRVLLNEAIAASEEASAAAPPPDACAGLDRFLGVPESFDLRLAAIFAPTVCPFGAAAGTNGKSSFYKPEQMAAVGRTFAPPSHVCLAWPRH